MPTFPILSSGSMKVYSPLSAEAVAMYPATLNHGFVTRVLKFINDSEQRFTVRRELFSVVLDFHDIGGYDLGLLMGFFEDLRGMYVDPLLLNVFDITIDGVNYQWCVIDQDQLDVTSTNGLTFSTSIAIKQVRQN